MAEIQKILTGRLFFVRLILLAAMVALIIIGIVTIYAAGNPSDPAKDSFNRVPSSAWKKQAVYAFGGLGALIIVNLINYRWLGYISYWLYAGTLVVLTLLLIDKKIDIPFVPLINGTRRWIRIGTSTSFVQLQPSEFCKIAYILALAWYLRYRSNYRKFTGLIGPFFLTLLAMVLILLEPDLGTVMLMMPILFAMLFVAGAKVKHLLRIVLLAILVSPFLWTQIQPYQRMRISSVLLQNNWVYKKAEQNPKLAEILAGSTSNLALWRRDKGYQLTQSKYAVASGGISGYGFCKGPYLQGPFPLYRVPEKHNDFIFTMIAHQWGIIGCLLLFLLYAVIIACGLEIAWNNTDPFARLLTIGIVSMFAVEVIVNVSMTMGLMPITGLTLPLVSYGGSSLVVSMTAIGLLNNVGRRRPFTVAGKGLENIMQ